MDLAFTGLYALLAFASLFIISFVVCGVQLLPLLWKKDAPWYERARILWPARSVIALVQIIGAAAFCFYPQAPFSAARLLWFLCAFSGALLCVYLFHPLFLGRRYSFPSWFRHWLTMTIIFAMPLLATFLVACGTTPRWTLTTTLQLTGLLVFYAGWLLAGPTPVLRALGLVSPVPDNLLKLVAEESATIGLPPPRSFVVHWHMPNAAALPITQQLLFSSALLAEFNDQELRTIIRHEIGHLTESRKIQAARAAALLIFLPAAFIVPIITSYGPGTLLVCYAIVFVVYLLTLKLSRQMEVRADAIANTDCDNEAIYAKALLHLYSRALLPAVVGKRATTHPDLYDRLVSCGVTPDFPRPKRPARLVPILLIMAGISATIFAAHLGSGCWRE